MRHRMRGRKLGRNASHRKAMFRNMACSLIRSLRFDEEDPERPKTPGRIVTTEAKAKELRPYVEKLITLARKSAEHEQRAEQYATSAARNTAEWKQWRDSPEWNEWAQAIAPSVALRRRAFAQLRDTEAVDILFDELADRFRDRPGGYTRVVRLPEVRLGDAGTQALIEFVGERDRQARKRQAPVIADDEPVAQSSAEEEPPAASEEPAADDEPAAQGEASAEPAEPGEGETEEDSDKNASES